MRDLKRSAPLIFGSVSMGRYQGVRAGAYVLAFAKDPAVAIYMNMLRRDDKRAVVEEALARAGGTPARLCVEHEGEAPQPRDAQQAAQQRLDRVFDVFGRENVQVTDE